MIKNIFLLSDSHFFVVFLGVTLEELMVQELADWKSILWVFLEACKQKATALLS